MFCRTAPPGETPAPPLPSLPLTKPAYPVPPPPPPQVFIIKENRDSSKDPEDSKSAEALDNLSQTFEDAFTEAYKSERRKGRLHDEPRRERFRQRLHEHGSYDSDSEESQRGHLRQRLYNQETSEYDSEESRRRRFRQRLRDQDNSDSGSDLDLEDELVKDIEKEEDEERMQSSVGSRREFGHRNATDDNENNEENDINDVSDNADDNTDNSDDDGHDDDDYDDDADDHKDFDVNIGTEPSYDADEPRHSHSQPYHKHRDTMKHRKQSIHLGLDVYDRSSRLHKNSREQFQQLRRKPNRFVKHQSVRSHTHRKKHPVLKNKEEEEMSQKFVFDSSRDKNLPKNPPKIAAIRTRAHHKARKKIVTNLKHHLKIHYYAKEKSKLPARDDTSNFAHLQDNDSRKNHHKRTSKHHIHDDERHNHQYSHQHGNEDSQQYNHHHSHQHGNQHSQQHGRQYSHSNTETIIPDEEISETSASSEGSTNIEDEGSSTAKPEERISSLNYDEDTNHHHPTKNGDVKKNFKTHSGTRQSFMPTAPQKLLKHKNFKSNKSSIEDGDYSSADESGENEISDTEGSGDY